MKKFLYLVQTRIAHLNQYRDLASSEADVIYLTFEEKIDQPNYIYAPNTDWTEGRNCLIEAAKKREPYQYYSFLDDDLEFTRGDFRLFEQEVLATQLDFAVPVYQDNKTIGNYERMLRPLIKFGLIRYSHMVSCDPAFICLSHQLFYDNKLLPYHMRHDNEFKNSFGSSDEFLVNLFEYHGQRKLYVINRVRFKNTRSLNQYNEDYHYSKLKQRLKQDQPDYQFLLEKYVPATPILQNLYYQIYHQHKAPLLLFIVKIWVKAKLYAYVYPLTLYKDVKLAVVLWRQRRKQLGGGYNEA